MSIPIKVVGCLICYVCFNKKIPEEVRFHCVSL